MASPVSSDLREKSSGSWLSTRARIVTDALHEDFFHIFYRTILRLGRILFILDFRIKEGII